MPAVNYMTIGETQSIWNVTLDVTRFGNVGVRIAEQLNFWIYDDATTQCADGAITPILEQLSEEILFDLIQTAKGYSTVNPWDFIQANVVRVSQRILSNYGQILQKIRTLLNRNKTIEIVEVPL